jgi:hypothetical protein
MYQKTSRGNGNSLNCLSGIILERKFLLTLEIIQLYGGNTHGSER